MNKSNDPWVVAGQVVGVLALLAGRLALFVASMAISLWISVAILSWLGGLPVQVIQ